MTLASDEYGYPATEEFLADRAVYPDSWNADHSEVGLYSHPSYRLSVETVTDTGTESAVRIENDLATPVSGAVVLSVEDCDGLAVEGGSREWTRTDGDVTECKVAYEVSADDETTVRVRCRSA